MGILDLLGVSFHGVSKAELNKIAKSCQHGSYVSVSFSGDRLCYHFKSNRGHQRNCQEFIVSDGKLSPTMFGGVPGYSPDKKFMSICNSRFDFT